MYWHNLLVHTFALFLIREVVGSRLNLPEGSSGTTCTWAKSSLNNHIEIISKGNHAYSALCCSSIPPTVDTMLLKFFTAVLQAHNSIPMLPDSNN